MNSLTRKARAVESVFRDERAQAYVEYIVVVLFVVVAFVAAAQLLSRLLVGYMKRIFYVVSLPLP